MVPSSPRFSPSYGKRLGAELHNGQGRPRTVATTTGLGRIDRIPRADWGEGAGNWSGEPGRGPQGIGAGAPYKRAGPHGFFILRNNWSFPASFDSHQKLTPRHQSPASLLARHAARTWTAEDWSAGGQHHVCRRLIRAPGFLSVRFTTVPCYAYPG